MMYVMEAFIAANRALLDGVDGTIQSMEKVPPHFCTGGDCPLHKAVLQPLETALDDNARLGEFISEVLGQTRAVRSHVGPRYSYNDEDVK